MINKERILLMIKLAMREDEFGDLITRNGPHRKEYVGGQMFVFFFVESLLYLIIAALAVLLSFLHNGFSLSMDRVIYAAIALFVGYLVITIIGEYIVRRVSLKRYKQIKEARKDYKENLDILAGLLDGNNSK